MPRPSIDEAPDAPARPRAGSRGALAVLAVSLVVLALGATSVRAAAGRVDGISDQSMPAWDGSFAASPLGAAISRHPSGGGAGAISFSRYVVQWNAAAQASRGADPHGDYRARLEAWFVDVRAAALQPVLALTSYDGVEPRSAAEYGEAAEALLQIAAGLGVRVGFLEPWNEPNVQGRLGARAAAELANVAHSLCTRLYGCEVIAGDLQDGRGAVAYERAYAATLRFHPSIWGIHPYEAVAAHDARGVLDLRQALPGAGLATQLWFTEVGAYYCKHGVVRGEARQASDAAYLQQLIANPAIAPAHVFYYGLLSGDGREASCAIGGGDDTELYAQAQRPRAAASVVLGRAALGPATALGAPAPAPAPAATAAPRTPASPAVPWGSLGPVGPGA